MSSGFDDIENELDFFFSFRNKIKEALVTNDMYFGKVLGQDDKSAFTFFDVLFDVKAPSPSYTILLYLGFLFPK